MSNPNYRDPRFDAPPPLRDDDLPAAERADAQPRVATDENVDLAELRAPVDGRGD